MKKLLYIAIMLSALLLIACGEENKNTNECESAEITVESAEDTERATEEADESSPETPHETVIPEVTEAFTEQENVWTEPDYPEIITTSGGVVIVGKVVRDSLGWTLSLDSPLHIVLQDNENEREFTQLTKIGMPESSVDGIDKSVYLGATVTVEGVLSYNGYDGVNLSVYSIRMGRNTKMSHNDPDVKKPERIAPDGETVIIPEKMKTVIEDGKYKYNPYKLSNEALTELGGGFAAFYVDFIDAYINYEGACECPDIEYAKILSTVLFFEGAVFEADGIYDFITDYDPYEKRINIRYKKSREEHDALIEDMFEKMDGFLSGIDPEAGEKDRAKSAYHALCPAVKYDYDALERLDMNNPYYAFTQNRGVCITFANAYLQLLTQVEVANSQVSGLMVNGEAHAWSFVTIDGLNYYCDPTFETSRGEGRGFVFFGMNVQKRTKDGTGTRGVNIGRYYPKMSDLVEFAPESLQ
ncbi:MAG: hypothetical protein IJN17_06435 [Clostridia bacterium]|nr:hypothetical protein [Clostridia bacterium]